MAKTSTEFSVDVLVYEDGTLGAVSEDIRGLVLECRSLGELQTELLWVAPRLLKTNHGLTDKQISGSVLNLRIIKGEDDPAVREAGRTNQPRLVYPDARQVHAAA